MECANICLPTDLRVADTKTNANAMEGLHEDDGNTINEVKQHNADRDRRACIPILERIKRTRE